MDKISLSPEFLWRLGFRHLSQEQVRVVLYDIYETLELLVGQRLATGMTRSQTAEFERALAKSESAALAWLESTFPMYRDVVASEYAALERRLRLAVDMQKEHARATG